LGDPVGPKGVFLQSLTVPQDSTIVGAPGQPFPQALRYRAVDENGRSVPAARVEWALEGTGARLLSADSVTGGDGTFQSIWVLGTKASDAQRLTVITHVGSHVASLVATAVAKPVVVTQVRFAAESLTVKLGVPTPVSATATDPYGNVFTPGGLRFFSTDTNGVTVDSSAQIHVLRRGYLKIVATAAGVSDTAIIHGVQTVATIVPSVGALSFQALGEERTMTATMIDDHGLPVLDSLPAGNVAPTGIVNVQVAETTLVRSQTNGTGTLILSVGSVVKQVPFTVIQSATHVSLTPAGPTFDALNDTLRLSASVQDSLGFDLTTPALVFTSSDSNVISVDAGGLLRSRKNGTASVVGRAASGASDTILITVAQRVTSVVVPADTIRFDALQAATALGAVAKDRLGNPVASTTLSYSVVSPSVVSVDTGGKVRALANGTSLVYAVAASDTATIVVSVAQRPVRILLASDTIRFAALGETQTIGAVAVDSLGFRVAGSVGGVTIQDTAVVGLLDSVTLHSKGDGATRALFTEAGLSGSVPVVVQQIPDTIVATWSESTPILSLTSGMPLPLTCVALDRNHQPIVGMPISAVGTFRPVANGTNCGALSVARSGLDTLTLTAGAARTRAPVAVAIPPSLAPGQGADIGLDSFPANAGPWAPTARVNSHGQVELYSTAYIPDSTTHHSRGSLYRFVSSDGVNFRFDSMVVANDNPDCNLNGSGVENIAIVPRADSAGWRMFYSSGSFTCYGWQVFSAVSSDERHWTKESGVRLANGAPLTGNPPTSLALWPSGEGIVPEQLPDGTWRVFSGTYEHLSPPQVKFQITEWTSPDQLNWTYVQPVLTTRDLPPAAQRSVYSPTIVQFAPGLWRMVFTGDNLNVPGGQSTLWSAVSTDEIHWQSEGQLLSTVGVNYYYSTIAAGRLYFLREVPNVSRKIEYASIAMP